MQCPNLETLNLGSSKYEYDVLKVILYILCGYITLDSGSLSRRLTTLVVTLIACPSGNPGLWDIPEFSVKHSKRGTHGKLPAIKKICLSLSCEEGLVQQLKDHIKAHRDVDIACELEFIDMTEGVTEDS